MAKSFSTGIVDVFCARTVPFQNLLGTVLFNPVMAVVLLR